MQILMGDIVSDDSCFHNEHLEATRFRSGSQRQPGEIHEASLSGHGSLGSIRFKSGS
jgi:hypothetical protein